MKVAFLGLGAMGSLMAKNIVAGGFETVVWNRTPAAAAPLAAQGAHVAATPQDAVAGADLVIAMLTDDHASEQVWNAALAAMKPEAIAVECSTVTPEWILKLSQLTASRKITLLDAPVSGSLPQAEAGKLIIMAGGTEKGLEAARPVLSTMGSVSHVGAAGQGAVFKLAVNALLGIQIAGWAEMLGFLKKNGVDLNDAVKLLTTMPVCSPAAAGMVKLMMDRDFAPRFTTTLLAKDFRYLQQTADAAGSEVPISKAASGVFEEAAKTMSAENVTAVIRLYES